MNNKLFAKSSLSQLEAAIETLEKVIESSSEKLWLKAETPFWQISYHAIFFVDFYSTDFEKNSKDPQNEYSRPGILGIGGPEGIDLKIRTDFSLTKEKVREYIEYSKNKAEKLITTFENFDEISGFEWLKMPKAEVVTYITRHVQSHASYMNGILKQNQDKPVGWVGKGTSSS